MGSDIDHLHHVGHVVEDMQQGLDLFAQLGFTTTPPSYPALPPEGGGEPRAFGVGNSHATFEGSFVEVMAKVHEDRPVPAGAHLAPLEVPEALLPIVSEMIGKSVGLADWCLSRFEGLHILLFDAPDAERVAARFTDAGLDHGGVTTVQRKVDGPDGPELATVRFIEIAPHDGGPSRVPEGRLGVAEPPVLERLTAGDDLAHPNGAYDLIESVLCTADDEHGDVVARYATYLDRAPRTEGPATVFDLDGARCTIVPASRLGDLLPGETPRALPGFVAYAVAVRDATATRSVLEANGLPVAVTAAGDPFVPSAAALGANVIFRQLG